MKKLLVLFLALALVLCCFASCGKEEKPAEEKKPNEEQKQNPDDDKPDDEPTVDINAKSEGVMTYAEYMAAENDSEVVIEAFVQQLAYNEQYANANIYLQDGDGAYYAYRLPLTADEAAKITKGAKLKITGFKSEWSGEVEINCESDASYEIEEGTYVAEATDITELLGKDELINEMNKFVSIKGAVVVGKDGASAEEPVFLYNWDGSGEEGSDLYFDVTVGEATYSLTVETDEVPATSDVYAAVKGLKAGDKVNVEAFLYWYNGANPHVCGIEVIPAE